MDYVIRRAEVDDATAIARVLNESWRTTYAGIVPDAYLASLSDDAQTTRWKQRLAQADLATFVAEDQTGVLGFASGGRLRAPIDGYDGELYAVYLIRERQRGGVGRALLRRIAMALHGAGFHSAAVWVLEDNVRAIAFYRAMGAVELERAEIEIGGASLKEIALGWATLSALVT